jgi:hypothetical protein
MLKSELKNQFSLAIKRGGTITERYIIGSHLGDIKMVFVPIFELDAASYGTDYFVRKRMAHEYRKFTNMQRIKISHADRAVTRT